MTVLNPVTPEFLDRLRRSLPAAAFRELSDAYLIDPRRLIHGKAGAVLAPGNAEETAIILKAANAARIAVVPYSGGTGLVGGQLGADLPDPIVLSTERMDRIVAVYPQENVVIAEAGAILQNIRAAADAQGRYFPLLLASEGSARLGGNLATNAGGMNVLRYGTARELCLGIEAVLADGTILGGLKRLRKDNTGYSLRDLLIGSEGTLGIITAASMRLFARPARNLIAFLVVPDPKAALALLALAGEHAGEMVSVFELISGVSFDFIAEVMPDQRPPFATTPEWAVLLDIGLPAAIDAGQLGDDLLAAAMEAGMVLDGVIAHNDAQRGAFFAFREAIPAANRRIGAVASHDISLPLSAIPEFIPRAAAKLSAHGPYRINCFGHLGDGNLHYNVFPPQGEARDDYLPGQREVSRIVHDLVAEYGGSFSAEHGVGRFKTQDLARYGDPGRLATMRAIKAVLDPNGILNPGAVLG